MSHHYYSKLPVASHDRQKIQTTLRGQTLSFVTDAGVFSKNGIDYGSKLLIEHMQFSDDAKVLDVGCGYGPIGLFAATIIDPGIVTMLDVNERAVALAQENAKLNDIHNVRIFQSDLFDNLEDDDFTAIVTNPPIRAGKEIVHRIYEEAKARLSEDGELWVVIQKKQGAASTLRKLQHLYPRVEEVVKSKGYRVYRAFKGSILK